MAHSPSPTAHGPWPTAHGSYHDTQGGDSQRSTPRPASACARLESDEAFDVAASRPERAGGGDGMATGGGDNDESVDVAKSDGLGPTERVVQPDIALEQLHHPEARKPAYSMADGLWPVAWPMAYGL